MTITDTISFITSESTEEDMGQIISALMLRRQVFGQIKAATATQGSEVVLEGLSPKYLVWLIRSDRRAQWRMSDGGIR